MTPGEISENRAHSATVEMTPSPEETHTEVASKLPGGDTAHVPPVLFISGSAAMDVPIAEQKSVTDSLPAMDDKIPVTLTEFTFENHPETKFRPIQKMRPRRTIPEDNTEPKPTPFCKMRPHASPITLNVPASEFSMAKTLKHASEEERENFGSMLNTSLNYRVMSRWQDQDAAPTKEDALDTAAYASQVQLDTTAETWPAEKNVFSCADLQEVAKAIERADASQSVPTSADGAATRRVKPPRRIKFYVADQDVDDNNGYDWMEAIEDSVAIDIMNANKQSVFFQPSKATRQSELESARNHTASSQKSLRLESSFPDPDNHFYHPSMTLSSAAQLLVVKLKEARAFTAHYSNDQILLPSTLKPALITQMEALVQHMRWAAQFLTLGKLGLDLVTLPDSFLEDVKVVLEPLRKNLGKLSSKPALRFLEDGLEELDRIEKAIWKLQGRRREIWEKSKVEFEARRVGKSVEILNREITGEDWKVGNSGQGLDDEGMGEDDGEAVGEAKGTGEVKDLMRLWFTKSRKRTIESSQ